MKRVPAIAALVSLLAIACDGGEPPERSSPAPSPQVPVPTATASPTAAPRWERLAEAPTARLEVAAAAVGGKLFVAGGLVPGGATRVLEIYDPAADSWSRGPDLPVALHHASGVAFQGNFVILGGFAPGSGGTFGNASRDVWRLQGDRWVRMPPLNRARGAAAAGVAGRRIVVAGGQGGGRLVPETEVFDGNAWRLRAPIPTPRDHVAGAAGGPFLYVAGGRKLSIESVLGAFERYDPARDRWETLPDLPTPRGGFGAAFTGATIVTVGGEGPVGTYEHVEAYDVGSRRWASLPVLPLARHASAVAVIGGRLLVAAGGPQAGGSYSARLDALTLSVSPA